MMQPERHLQVPDWHKHRGLAPPVRAGVGGFRIKSYLIALPTGYSGHTRTTTAAMQPLLKPCVYGSIQWMRKRGEDGRGERNGARNEAMTSPLPVRCPHCEAPLPPGAVVCAR